MTQTPLGDLQRRSYEEIDSTKTLVRTINYDSEGNDKSIDGCIDNNNSTHTTLLANETFTGVATDILQCAIIYVTVYSDVPSAADGLIVEQGHSENGIETIHWDSDDKFTIPSETGKTFSIQPALQYLRIRYTNGPLNQVDFRLHVVKKRVLGLDSSHRIQDPIIDDDDARLVKSVLTAKTPTLGFINLTATDSGNFKTTDAENGLAIAKGDVVNTSFIHKFGATGLFDVADGFVDIWDGADSTIGRPAYQYTYSSTADIDQISSSNNSDTEVIEVQGLASGHILTTQNVTLTGQTPATLATPLIRVFRMKNIGSTDIVGDVYLTTNGATLAAGVPATSTDIRAIIRGSNNQTLMAIYTIPAGKTGYLRDWYAATAGARRASVHVLHLYARPFGQVFQLKHVSSIVSSGTSQVQHKYNEPEVFLEKTDIVMHTNTDENDAAMAAGFDIVLIDN